MKCGFNDTKKDCRKILITIFFHKRKPNQIELPKHVRNQYQKSLEITGDFFFERNKNDTSGPSLVCVQWVQLFLQILRKTDFAPNNFEEIWLYTHSFCIKVPLNSSVFWSIYENLHLQFWNPSVEPCTFYKNKILHW